MYVNFDKRILIKEVDVRLYQHLGDFYTPLHSPTIINASGYMKLNRYTGVSIIQPGRIFYGGEMVGNPHIVMDKNIAIGAYIKGYGIGLTPMGETAIVESVVYYDAIENFALKLLKNVKDYPQAGFISKSPDKIPEEIVYYGSDGNERSYSTGLKKWNSVFLKFYGLYLCYDVSHPSIIDIVFKNEQYRNRITALVNTALIKQVLRTHPSIGIKYIDTDRIKTGEGNIVYADVPVNMVSQNISEDEYFALVEMARNGEIDYSGDYNLIQNENVCTEDEVDLTGTKVESNEDERRKELMGIIKKNASYFLDQKFDKQFADMTLEELDKVVGDFMEG